VLSSIDSSVPNKFEIKNKGDQIMELQNWEDWVAWAGIVLPLTVLSISSVLFVRNEISKSQIERYDRFWSVMLQAGQKDGNIAAKMAAFFEMRKFPEYSEVIIRLCEGAGVAGPEGELLKAEMNNTAQYLRSRK
jgi:hypothetical protein